MIEFRQKDFSFLSNVIKGASAVASLGTIAAGIGGFRRKNSDEVSDTVKELAGRAALGTILIGASLGAAVGALCSGVDAITKKSNIRSTVNKRLMNDVVAALKSAGLKEGSDFTRDSKEATRLKTKICISISKVNGDLKILINQISDPKLKDITKDLVKNLPNYSAVTEKKSDRFNDIVITTISDSSADAGLVTGIAERFIHSGYPVYLIEVG